MKLFANQKPILLSSAIVIQKKDSFVSYVTVHACVKDNILSSNYCKKAMKAYSSNADEVHLYRSSRLEVSCNNFILKNFAI